MAASNSSYFSPYTLALRAAELFLETDPSWSSPESYTDPSSWGEYEGSYQDPVNVGRIEVSLDADEKLYVRFVDQDDLSLRLYQYANDEFFFVNSGYNYIRFARDPEDGQVRFFANRYFVGDREAVMGAAPEGAAARAALRRGAEPQPRPPRAGPGPD